MSSFASTSCQVHPGQNPLHEQQNIPVERRTVPLKSMTAMTRCMTEYAYRYVVTVENAIELQYEEGTLVSQPCLVFDPTQLSSFGNSV